MNKTPNANAHNENSEMFVSNDVPNINQFQFLLKVKVLFE